jgi:hypothetical protein
MIFGNPSSFAIECAVEPSQTSPAGVRGRLCLAVGGQRLGDFDDVQLLDDALLILRAATPIRPDTDAEFAGKTSLQTLDLLYRTDQGLSQKGRRFLICPDLGAAFDGLYLTRIRYAGHDELIWRWSGETAAHAVALGLAEYDAVVDAFDGWLREVRSS